MILFLAAQDISRMEAALLDSEGRFLSFQEFAASPEEYLATTGRFLVEHAASFEDLERIVVVSGPGSFTSTRVIVTIANTFTFARNLPIVGVANAARLGGEELIRQAGRKWVKQKTEGFIRTVYDRPPHITIKKV
jgi:tRNA A37 threonylcarbamoyladenosine modification protein TsaB